MPGNIYGENEFRDDLFKVFNNLDLTKVVNVDASGISASTTKTLTLPNVDGTIVTTINVDTTAVGNVGGGEDDLITYSLPANALNVNGKGVKVKVWGTTAANANNKTIKLFFGATELRTSGALALNNKDWILESTIIRTGATAQEAIGHQLIDATAIGVTQSNPAEDTTGAIVVKVTGESSASASNDVIAEGMVIENIN